MFETFSFLPPLSDEAIAKQVRGSCPPTTWASARSPRPRAAQLPMGGVNPAPYGSGPGSGQGRPIWERPIWDPPIWDPPTCPSVCLPACLPVSVAAQQVEFIVANGWTPCLEFAEAGKAYTANDNVVRVQGTSSLYYDNR